MTHRLYVNEDAGQVGFVLHRGEGVVPGVGAPQPFASPFQGEELEDLRWYLEDYLRAPYAVWEERGGAIEQRLGPWGEALFEQLFGPGRPGRDVYLETQGGDWELWLSSRDPRFLGLPFELMREPGRPEPLAFGLAGINRTLPERGAPLEVRTGATLRVLMVIARPRGEADAGYRSVARPLFDKLQAVAGKVEVELCRPPSFAELKRRLAAAKGAERPYDILHFDGHGTFGAPGGEGDPHMFRGDEQGFLEFEGATDKDRLISAATFGTEIDQAGVPLVVFNACRSGQLGAEVGPEATVATRLLQSGTAAVVAMSHAVYVRAAAEFMAAFYEALFQGEPVTRAVARGRRQLRQANLRPSPKGDLPLQDWCVPVHYGRREVSFPQLRQEPTRPGISLELTLATLRAKDKEATEDARDPFAPVGRFVGRDREFYRLEQALGPVPGTLDGAPAALCRHPVTLIQGLGGTGKTELAKAFARWLGETGWATRTLFHSFEPGVATFGLDGLVGAIGLELFGTDFIGKTEDAEHRRAVVLDVLRRHRLVLVLDNFETARSMPDPSGVTPPLDDTAAEALRVFLAALGAGASSLVLITSRSPEAWLDHAGAGVRLNRIELEGLAEEDVNELADHLLAGLPAAQARRGDKAFGELLQRLRGHPLGLRLILPQLETHAATDLIAGLEGRQDLPTRGDEDLPERLRTLDACVAYSLDQLGTEAVQRLVALSLFEGVADGHMLRDLSDQESAPARFRGMALDDWVALLDRAVTIGLLAEIGQPVYRMHPALPGYLRQVWRNEAGDAFDTELDAAEQALITASAQLGSWLYQQIKGGEAGTAMALIDLQRRSIGRVLGEALNRGRYAEAQQIMQPLDAFWNARGLLVEARGWADRVRLTVEASDGAPPDFDSNAGALWLFAVVSEANRAGRSGRPEEADRIYAEIATTLERSGSESAKRHLATAHHQRGVQAQSRGALADAEAWYQKSLAIKEELGDRPGMASSYHQLGMVAQQRGALAGAEAWYQKALGIAEELGNRPYQAAILHQLGMVAQDRGALADAEAWYQKALGILEALGDRPARAKVYAQLGVLEQARGNEPDALDWAVRCVALFEDFPNPQTGTGPRDLVTLTAALGMDVLADSWRRCTGQPLPGQIRNDVEVAARELARRGDDDDAPSQPPSLLQKIAGVFRR